MAVHRKGPAKIRKAETVKIAGQSLNGNCEVLAPVANDKIAMNNRADADSQYARAT